MVMIRLQEVTVLAKTFSWFTLWFMNWLNKYSWQEHNTESNLLGLEAFKKKKKNIFRESCQSSCLPLHGSYDVSKQSTLFDQKCMGWCGTSSQHGCWKCQIKHCYYHDTACLVCALCFSSLLAEHSHLSSARCLVRPFLGLFRLIRMTVAQLLAVITVILCWKKQRQCGWKNVYGDAFNMGFLFFSKRTVVSCLMYDI